MQGAPHAARRRKRRRRLQCRHVVRRPEAVVSLFSKALRLEPSKGRVPMFGRFGGVSVWIPFALSWPG